MSQFSPKVCSMVALVAALSMAAASQAQAPAKLVPVTSTTSQPTDTGSARAWHDTTPKTLISARVRDGVLTIDGMVAKVQLNYDIQQTGYMYFFIPGVGTAVVSMAPLADGAKVPDAFDGEKLAFTVDGHSVELSNDGSSLLEKRKGKADVYVRLDRSTVALSRYPRMGYGDTTQAPYVWPLSAPEPANKEKVAYVVPPPPTPKSMLPQTASSGTPKQ
ncbi:MAG TPA: hypothetical protein VK814_03130 [Acidobacteriaceae bacterium]|nr:hypothetical protein [Acidobacteriaceae bacterium]